MAEYAIILNLLLRLLRTSQKMNKVKTNEIKRLIETGYALSILEKLDVLASHIVSS